MSWFPSFLTAQSAAIAAAIVLPALIALYFLKLRRKEYPVASTFLWKKAVQDLQVNAPFQKLRRNLLLILQLLLLLALLIAFARPVSFQKVTPGASSVILIDRSASMSTKDIEGKSRLDEAKRRAGEIVDSMPRNAKAAVIAFDDSADTVQTFTTDQQLLRNAIRSIEGTDRLTQLKTALQLADAAIAIDPEALRPGASGADIFLFSDGRIPDANNLTTTGNVRYEALGSDKTKNVGIVAMSARRNYENPTDVQVFARLANFGPEPVQADVVLSIGNIDHAGNDTFETSQVKQTATLLPVRWTEDQRRESEKQGTIGRDSVEFKLELTTAAIIRIEHKGVEGDALAADDVAQVIVPPPKRLSVTLVTNGNYFLEKAMNALGLDKPNIITPDVYASNPPADSDVIIFDHISPKTLPQAGNFVYFGGLPPETPLKQLADVERPELVLFNTDDSVLDWKRDHPLLRGLNMSRLFVAESMRLTLPPEAEVLIEGNKGPLVLLYRADRRTHLVVSFDVLQSNWPLRETFPYFLYNTMQFLAAGSELNLRESFQPGATGRLPRGNFARVVGGEPDAVKLIGPGENRSIKMPETGDLTLPPFARVGLYRTEPSVPQFERFAVNLLDDNESNIQPSATSPGGLGTADSSRIASGPDRRRVDWWWWIVVAVALPLLFVEWWVYTRRIHA